MDGQQAISAQVSAVMSRHRGNGRRWLFELADKWDERCAAGYAEHLPREGLAKSLLALIPEPLAGETRLITNLLAEIFYPPEDRGGKLLERVAVTTGMVRKALEGESDEDGEGGHAAPEVGSGRSG